MISSKKELLKRIQLALLIHLKFINLHEKIKYEEIPHYFKTI